MNYGIGMEHIYLEYLQLRNQLRSSTIDTEIDQSELKILETVTLSNHLGTPLTVSNVIQMRQLGSNSTIHKKIYKLIESEFIELYHQNDYRTKYLRITAKTQKHFEKESEIIKKICKKMLDKKALT